MGHWESMEGVRGESQHCIRPSCYAPLIDRRAEPSRAEALQARRKQPIATEAHARPVGLNDEGRRGA